MSHKDESPVGLDLMASGGAFLCLVHCLLFPVLVTVAPALARAGDWPEWFHLVALGFALPVSIWGMRRGYRRHGRIAPGIFAGLGLALLMSGLAFHDEPAFETGLTILGSLALMLAHFRNWRFMRKGPPYAFAHSDGHGPTR